ncbi:DNA repair protein-like protein [Lachnellula occidentalis]|uniref:DNA repair protein-like protein n=1 Tax=Lachnellula occidentalis TaxID=215460 RepID=A0A8H8S3W9_9HELO|nr:DNA repair protein-like protein [Lachnellula occidentalis]
MGAGSVYAAGDEEDVGFPSPPQGQPLIGCRLPSSTLMRSKRMTLCACPSKRLLKIKGFSDIKVEKIKEVAKKLSPTSGFITAAELGHIRKRCIRISTGSKQLDAALNG